MEAERRAQYERLVEYLEEPVRDIVPAVWGAAFCEGHGLQLFRAYFGRQWSWVSADRVAAGLVSTPSHVGVGVSSGRGAH